MAIVDLDLRPGLEALSLQVSPTPSKLIEISPMESVAVVVDQITSAFLDTRNGSNLPLEYRNPFGQWKPTTEQEALGQLGSSIRNAFSSRDRLDVGRGIDGIQVAIHEGLPNWRVLQRLVFGSEWLFTLTIDKWMNLGQGTAIFTYGEGWTTTQRPGLYPNKTHTMFRELRIP